MEAKISFLHDGVKGLSDTFKDFQHITIDFTTFSAEHNSDQTNLALVYMIEERQTIDTDALQIENREPIGFKQNQKN